MIHGVHWCQTSVIVFLIILSRFRTQLLIVKYLDSLVYSLGIYQKPLLWVDIASKMPIYVYDVYIVEPIIIIIKPVKTMCKPVTVEVGNTTSVL